MRDEKEERKKQARSNKQTRQSNTAHPMQSLFRAASGGTRTHDTLYFRQSALPTCTLTGRSWCQSKIKVADTFLYNYSSKTFFSTNIDDNIVFFSLNWLFSFFMYITLGVDVPRSCVVHSGI